MSKNKSTKDKYYQLTSRYAKIKGVPRAEIAEIITRLMILFKADQKKVSDWLYEQKDSLSGKSAFEALKEEDIKSVFDLLREEEKNGDIYKKISKDKRNIADKIKEVAVTAKAVVSGKAPEIPERKKKSSKLKAFFRKKDE